MVNEATPVELYGSNNSGDKRRFACASGVAITKGSLLKFADPRTASLINGPSEAMIAGIAAMDKEANDNSTSISVWTNGIFEMTASGVISLGNSVVSCGSANKIDTVANITAASGAQILGYALESADAGEIINVRVLV